jgi:hypothetical protein
MRCIIYGAAGSGKTTLAQRLLVDAPQTTRFIDGYAGEPLDRAGAWIITVQEGGGVLPSMHDCLAATIVYEHVGAHTFLVRLPAPPQLTYGLPAVYMSSRPSRRRPAARPPRRRPASAEPPAIVLNGVWPVSTTGPPAAFDAVWPASITEPPATFDVAWPASTGTTPFDADWPASITGPPAAFDAIWPACEPPAAALVYDRVYGSDPDYEDHDMSFTDSDL